MGTGPQLCRFGDRAMEAQIELKGTPFAPAGDRRLYIRVQQEDGHRMWTSVICLFRA